MRAYASLTAERQGWVEGKLLMMLNVTLSVRHARTIAGLGAALLLALPIVLPDDAWAQDGCQGDTATCAEASALAKSLMQGRVNRTLATTPADERFTRLNTPGTSAVVPFDMTPDGSNTNVRTSLSQWSASLSAADEERLKELIEASEKALPLPEKVTPAPSKVDVWAEGRREAYNGAGDAVTTFLGADYRASNNLLLGGMFQVD